MSHRNPIRVIGPKPTLKALPQERPQDASGTTLADGLDDQTDRERKAPGKPRYSPDATRVSVVLYREDVATLERFRDSLGPAQRPTRSNLIRAALAWIRSKA